MIGVKLRDARNACDLTQEEVAERIQVSRQTLSNWENEKTYPDINSVLKLSDLYGVSLDCLLKDDEKMIKHMEDTMDTVKSNRLMILMWTLCPVGFFILNLLTGGIVVGRNFFAIHGPAFFWMLFLVIALALVSIGINVIHLSKKKKAAANAAMREIMSKSDLLRFWMPVIFLVLAILTLCFFL